MTSQMDPENREAGRFLLGLLSGIAISLLLWAVIYILARG